MTTKDVNSAQVVQMTKVRKTLKKDGCWIRKDPDPDKELDKPRNPELPKEPVDLSSPESVHAKSQTARPRGPKMTMDVCPMAPEEMTDGSMTPSTNRPLAQSHVHSAARKFDQKNVVGAASPIDVTPEKPDDHSLKVPAKITPKELSEAIIQEAVKEPMNAEILAEKDVMVPATEPTATPFQGQSSSLVLPQADAEQHHQKIIHEFRHTEDGKAICSYCNNSIVENVKITVSYPPTYSHLYCFKFESTDEPDGRINPRVSRLESGRETAGSRQGIWGGVQSDARRPPSVRPSLR
ncbi:hypothetical protein DPEC_G00231990 [Dallia pectoralis]|uniref:Uncharacterized protein n=1 Tax=Dallia pectoralis TaxID=75939 RepID=A0ACC2FX69_DALPE|nr:hypothetical protein DPEC_G00231990 [Dallia pectoralis]